MRIFLSYSHKDATLAESIRKALEEIGFDVWNADSILPGENWASAVAAALQNADAMVVLLTEESIDSPNVNYEVGYALGEKSFEGRLVPVLAGHLEPERVPWVLRLKNLQLIDMRKNKGVHPGVDQIASALRKGA